MTADVIKVQGIHYTPPELARFLAVVTIRQLAGRGENTRVLDPACGDGALLRAFIEALPSRSRTQVVLTGFDTDPRALEKANTLLAGCEASEVHLEVQDFLSLDGVESPGMAGQRKLFVPEDDHRERYDVVIANPPYVRTQVLGADKAQVLAKRFRLTGRVDLYQAFTRAMANALKPGGVLGLLTSNRFLTIRAGEALRRLLRTEFDLRAVYDLGDTKLFAAAVLPVIVVATKRGRSCLDGPCLFHRVYEYKREGAGRVPEYPSVLSALEDEHTQGVIKTGITHFRIERGVLAQPRRPDEVWTLSTAEYDGWLQTVRSRQERTFADVAEIRVGIKTTADDVFVRSDWDCLPASRRPEPELLHPLITHHDSGRWTVSWSCQKKKVLYPHALRNGKRMPIRLEDYPRAAAYFRLHEARLQRRTYVVDAGRRWYEIWVPHNPADWSKHKIVFPDISETPRFCLDVSGAIVQGDCYWITLKAGTDPDWLILMLAVANSTFITKFYDLAFHNKLYSGRRRFMTQYVKDFPLPPLSSRHAQEIVKEAKRLVQGDLAVAEAESHLDGLVWRTFGLIKEVCR